MASFGILSALAVLLVAGCAYGQESENADFYFTAVNTVSQVFVDNVAFLPPNTPNFDNWLVADNITISRYSRLISVRVADLVDESCSGFMASFTTPDFIHFTQGRDWKCSTTGPTGWQNLGFNDSSWAPAFESGFNGQPVVGCSRIPIDDFPIGPQAYWIFTENYVTDIIVYCRGYTPVCAFNPCTNGGTCNVNSPAICTCPVRLTGRFCETTFSECESNPCQNSGECSETPDGYECGCQIGYTGIFCETDLTPCFSSPCLNGATCFSDVTNEYSCACVPGFTGSDCETNVDDCSDDACINGGTCFDLIDDYTCRCAPGYSGNNCQIDTDECLSVPCLNGASCIDAINGYACACYEGYTGLFCETGINECSSSPCLNGATCIIENAAVRCLCAPGWNGFRCEQNDDDCINSPCLNAGTCIDGDQSYNCTCAPNWVGDRCQTVMPQCGDLLHPAEYDPIRNFWALCQIDRSDPVDQQYVDTPCRELIQNINVYGNATDIVSRGGAFGCYATSEAALMPEGACVPNYQNDFRLSSCITCAYLAICIRVPEITGP